MSSKAFWALTRWGAINILFLFLYITRKVCVYPVSVRAGVLKKSVSVTVYWS